LMSLPYLGPVSTRGERVGNRGSGLEVAGGLVGQSPEESRRQRWRAFDSTGQVLIVGAQV
jgi:hypothetical protein